MSSPFVPCSLLWSCAPLFLSALSLFPWCIACKYAFISRFKGVFSVVYSARVGLFVLGALRGLCGFCVREWLGGLEARCVFAFVFPIFCLSFCLFPCFLSFVLRWSGCLSFPLVCPLVLSFLSCFGFVFSFSLAVYTQKKGRKGFALVSSLRVLCVFRFLYSYRKTPSLCIWLFPVRWVCTPSKCR